MIKMQEIFVQDENVSSTTETCARGRKKVEVIFECN